MEPPGLMGLETACPGGGSRRWGRQGRALQDAPVVLRAVRAGFGAVVVTGLVLPPALLHPRVQQQLPALLLPHEQLHHERLLLVDLLADVLGDVRDDPVHEVTHEHDQVLERESARGGEREGPGLAPATSPRLQHLPSAPRPVTPGPVTSGAAFELPGPRFPREYKRGRKPASRPFRNVRQLSGKNLSSANREGLSEGVQIPWLEGLRNDPSGHVSPNMASIEALKKTIKIKTVQKRMEPKQPR